MRLASTFHSLIAIDKKISPIESNGIQSIEASTFTLHCFETITDIKFLATCRPRTLDIPIFLRKVYEIYSDVVLKNPFYELDMPIKLQLFDSNINIVVKNMKLFYV